MAPTCEDCVTRPQLNTAIAKVKQIATSPSLVSGEYGGTGVKNKGKKIILGGNFTIGGSKDVKISAPLGGVSDVILPTSGVLMSAVLDQINTNNGQIGSANAIPTTSTPGTPGQLLAFVYDKNKYTQGNNLFSASLYICTGVNGTSYSWSPVSINIGEPVYN